MIAGFHGRRTNLGALRARHSISARGTSLGTLMEMAMAHGLAARALRVELASVGRLKLPCILHWELNHFVVLAAVGNGRCVVHDPATGVRKLSVATLSDKFTGVALELMPTASFERGDDRQRMRLRDFWTRITGLRGVLLQTLILSAIIQVFALAAPFYMQLVIDEVLAKFDLDLLVVLALGFGLFLLIREFTTALRSLQILYLGSMLDFGLSSNLARHLFRLPMSWFSKRQVGDVISRFASTRAVRQLFAEGLVATVIDGIMAVSTLLLMVIYSPLLAAVAVLALAVYLLIRAAFFRPLERRTEDEIVARASEQSALIESVRAIQSIKVFGKEAQRHALWQNRFADLMNGTVRFARLQVGFRLANGVVFGAENILIVYLGAGLVTGGVLTAGMLLAFLAFKRHLVDSATALIERLIEFRLLRLHLERVADIALARPEESAVGEPTVPPPRARREDPAPLLELARCSFAFAREDAPVISELSLDVRAGELLTIVGPSGCGKSTLLRMILGLVDPTEGEIRYRGRPVASLGKPGYRRLFGTVMQDDMLLSGTFAENIAFFEPAPDHKRIRYCARLACVDQDIAAMPMGYGSLIGDMGSVLSAGQRQRLLLARALYAKPEILLLDEATANLDPHTERAVVRSICGLAATRICVSHGDRIVQASDRVLTLHNGALCSAPAPRAQTFPATSPADPA